MKVLTCCCVTLAFMLVSTIETYGQLVADPNSKKMKMDSLLPDVSKYPVYNGNDLGLTYSKKKSIIKVWSPPATEMMLHLYENGEEGAPVESIRMKKGKNGVWTARLKGNKEGMYYTVQVFKGSTVLTETPDPYAVAAGVNGQRAMIIDLEKTNPEGWENDQRPPLNSYSDIILYEVHLRDISMHPASGIEHKGKFLGLAETGTTTPDGLSTGLDHIKELGVTHVHLLPCFDFRSIDETRLINNKYNWGYDPHLYNVPEGSYATDPYDGSVRIKEFKQLVKTLHDNGLRVVMDVVYNHTALTGGSVFNRVVPYYYYRMKGSDWSNASACGNETASDRPMFRKFMVESMKYWAQEYHIDGFRVDLMGIHDIQTMNEVSRELHAIDPTIFIYGEGWTGGESTLSENLRAVKVNTSSLDKIAAFSDEFRDGVKGHVFTPQAKGFASGENKLEESVKFGIVGAVDHDQIRYDKVNYASQAWAKDPTQCINYVSCHDNHTLWDRLKLSCQQEEEEELIKIDKLAQTIVFTSQGVPFLLSGEEFVRSKAGIENSFESPDHINQIEWTNKSRYRDLYDYYRALIDMRKHHPAFRMGSADAIRKNIRFLDMPVDNIIAYTIDGAAVGDTWKRILVIFNGNKVGKQVEIPQGNWKIICQNYRIVESGMGTISMKKANLLARSAFILVEE